MKKTLMILITGLAVVLSAAQSLAVDLVGVDIHGFISLGFLKTTENNFVAKSKDGSFEFNEVGINFGKELTDNMRVGLQLFGGDFGEVGNNEIRVDWVYGDYRFRDWLGVRFGQIKVPHGLYNETRDISMLRNPIFLPQSVYQEVTRDAYLSLQGGGIYGHFEINAVGGLSYQAMYGTQVIASNNRMAEALTGFYTDILVSDNFEVDYKYAASLIWDIPLAGLRLGVSNDNVKLKVTERWTEAVPGSPFGVGDLVSMDYDKLDNWVLSLEYTWNDLVLIGEFIQTFKKYKLGISNVSLESEPYGWYASATYRFTNWFELGGYYSVTKNDYPDFGTEAPSPPPLPDFYNELNDICVTARFDINEYWTFKLEGHSFEGAYGLSSFDNPNRSPIPHIPDYFETDWVMFAAKMTVAF